MRLQRGKVFWKGSVRIRVTGREPERFFNLCGHHNITLWDVTEHQGCFEMSLLPEDFFRLLPIRRKSGVRIRIQKKQGLPFFYRRSLKRKAFFIGIFLCLTGLYTLSQFIWNIHVEGNYANSTQTILNSLDAAGIHHGSWKKRVDCSQTASYLREQFPNLTWVSAKIEGTQLVLAVKENVDGYVIEEKADDPQNLVAKKEGTVVRIITRNGIPQVLPGDTCQAGDISAFPYGTDISESREKNAGIPDFCLPIFPWKSAAGEFCGEFAEHDRNGGSENREKGKWSRRGSVPSAALSDRKLCPSVLFRLPSEISF